MKTTRDLLTVVMMLAAIGLAGGSASAATLVEDFESSSGGSGTPPAGWSLVTVAGSPSYQTSAAGQGSNGAGGSAGLAGQVSSTAFIEDQLPGGYLVNSVDFDLSLALSGGFDFMLVAEGSWDDATFTVGAIADGITGNTPGELLNAKFYELTSGYGTNLANGNNSVLSQITSDRVQQNTWHKAEFTWTPTSGTTGDFSLTITDLNDSSTVGTLATTGFAFDSATAQVGFGSVNDTIRFDNVNINQASGPPPPAPIEQTLDTVADAYVQGFSGGTTNYGSATELRVKYNDSNNYNRKSYMRFDLNDLIGYDQTDLTDATLKLNVIDSGAGSTPGDKVWTFELYGLNDGDAGEGWIESAINWNNAPANDTGSRFELLGNATSLGTFDLTGKGLGLLELSSPELLSFLQSSTADDVVTFIITRNTPGLPGSQGADYVHAIASKEHGGVAGPQLVLTGPTTVIPEPMTMLAVGLSVAGLGGYIRKRRRA